MLSLLKWVMPKYKSFIVKMHLDSIKNKALKRTCFYLVTLTSFLVYLVFTNVEGDAHIDQVCIVLKCVHC